MYARRLYVKLKDEINTIEMDKKLNDVQKRIDEKEESKAAQSEAQTTQPKTSETESSSSLSAE